MANMAKQQASPAENVSAPQPPAGLEALYSACRKVYPDQPNPLQVTAVLKYWLGGPDPLDYISMYANPGKPEMDIPPHWHYITFGLSDLHGDGRVHDNPDPSTPSGYGFELTFRLQRELEDSGPPTWPAAILQALAKYVFQSGNTVCAGDHVSWHCPLDSGESRIQHMLLGEDPQLGQPNPPLQTPFGPIRFLQVVGVTLEELQAAQHWNGPAVLKILRRTQGASGPWLVTNMRRGESMYELDPSVQEEVEQAIEEEGSNLSGVSARCVWAEWGADGMSPSIRKGTPWSKEEEGDDRSKEQSDEEEEKDSRERRAAQDDPRRLRTCLKGRPLTWKDFRSSTSSASKSESSASNVMLESAELLAARILDGIHLTLNLEAGTLLPLALRGRIKHGRHFTFKALMSGSMAVTLVAASVTGAFVDKERPYAVQGSWVQVLIGDHLADRMLEDMSILSTPDEVTLPTTFSWSDHKLAVTIVPDCP